MNSDKKYLEARRPKGFREYLPQEQALFDSIYRSIEEVFASYGFSHIVTPDLELSDIMLAKGGGETEKEVYRFTKGKTDYCMPYDLTIPTARYISEHSGSIVFPFYRYQIQKRYRAENTQRGRAREFYQADIDIFGVENINADALIISVLYQALSSLNIDAFCINIGHRGLWSGFLDLSDQDKIGLMHLVDKKDKLQQDIFSSELDKIGISNRDQKLLNILLKADHKDIAKSIDALRSLPGLGSEFASAVDDIRALFEGLLAFNIPENKIVFNPSIVRGLDYYSGVVFETFFDQDKAFGSIASGGRYNRLLEYFSPRLMPAVGGSIGLTRLFEYILEKRINYDGSVNDFILPHPLDVFIAYRPDQSLGKVYSIASSLHKMGLKASFSLENSDLSSQLRYAQKIGVGNVLIYSEESSNLVLKDMRSGHQQEVTIDQVAEVLCK
jgi:histidyl-tRNA synthetase